jgi:hypothetical protein
VPGSVGSGSGGRSGRSVGISIDGGSPSPGSSMSGRFRPGGSNSSGGGLAGDGGGTTNTTTTRVPIPTPPLDPTGGGTGGSGGTTNTTNPFGTTTPDGWTHFDQLKCLPGVTDPSHLSCIFVPLKIPKTQAECEAKGHTWDSFFFECIISCPRLNPDVTCATTGTTTPPDPGTNITRPPITDPTTPPATTGAPPPIDPSTQCEFGFVFDEEANDGEGECVPCPEDMEDPLFDPMNCPAPETTITGEEDLTVQPDQGATAQPDEELCPDGSDPPCPDDDEATMMTIRLLWTHSKCLTVAVVWFVTVPV